MNNVQFVLDESAMLGNMSAIDDALGIGRAYRIRLQFYFQSVGQLKKCFPDGQEQTLFSNTSQIFFGVNESATAEFVSARLGEETIIVDSGGTSRAKTWQSTHGQQPSDSYSTSTTDTYTWQQVARKLLKPEEVIALRPRMAITFTPGVPPVCTWLLRYYEEKQLTSPARQSPNRWVELARFIAQLAWCGVLLWFAVCVTTTIVREMQMKDLSPQRQISIEPTHAEP